METNQIALFLSQTLSSDANIVRTATDSLDSLSTLPYFSFCLLSIAADGETQSLKVAAATYLKNFTRRNIDSNDAAQSSMVGKQFKDALMSALLKAEPAVLKLLIETFRAIVAVEFVKRNSWPELVPQLRAVIQSSDLIHGIGNSERKTVNILSVLHSLIRPFQAAAAANVCNDGKSAKFSARSRVNSVIKRRKSVWEDLYDVKSAKFLKEAEWIQLPGDEYFLNPKLAKEPVPSQLEIIAREILVPLLTFFHHTVRKALSAPATWEIETEKVILLICKCVYLAVRSHMPSALVPSLSSLCDDLFWILSSLYLDVGETPTDSQSLRLKTGKRSLLIFCALVTRHRKFSDKLLPNIIGCVSKIVKHSAVATKANFLSERIISLSFDVISRVLETGPGWRLVSPHFSNLLDCAIFPALAMNEKDIAEWEADPDEYIRKNLPTELEEISGWKEDLFTARKSALNLLGVIATSKGPPVVTSSVSSKRKKGEKNRRKDCRSMGELLVLPFLSKFPLPTNVNVSTTVNEYYGVLMAYSSLLGFLKEQSSGFTSTLIQNRLLPLYKEPYVQAYLVASANWVLGELASCIPEELNADIYSSLMKALAMQDMGHISCYPVRMSAAGAIAQLVDNEYMPPGWLPLLQVVVGKVGDEEESAVMLQLLGKLVEAGNESVAPHIPHIVSSLVETISECIPPKPEPWPQMVESGFATLATMAQCWEDAVPKEIEQHETCESTQASCKKSIKKSFSDLLQCAWLSNPLEMEDAAAVATPSPSSIDDASTLLGFIMQDIDTTEIQKLRVSELLVVWSDLISDWHAWEEAEDLSIFSCIRKAVSLNNKISLKNFFVGELPSTPAPPVPLRSIIEGIGAFVTEAFFQYPSAVWRASSCVHMLLHICCHKYEVEELKQTLVLAFSEAAFSRFKEIRNKPCSLWKPLLLAISSCYLCFPDVVEKILLKIERDGFTIFACALSFIFTNKFEHSMFMSAGSEIKLSVLALAKVVERLQRLGNQETALLEDCLNSLIEAFLKLLDLQREDKEEQSEGEYEDENEDNEDEDDEDSEEDELEETEEEFLERCAETASALENGALVEEGDIDDQDQEIELGVLEEVDVQRIVLSLIEKYRHIFQQGGALPPEIISGFLNAFPEYSRYFH